MKLYEISEAYLRVANNPELTDEEKADELNHIEDTFDDKISNCVKVIRNLKAEAEAYKAEARRLANKQKSAQNNVDSLKRYIISCIKTTGRSSAGEAPHKCFLGKSSIPKITFKLGAEHTIPSEYLRVSKEINRSYILDELKDNDWVIPDEINELIEDITFTETLRLS